MIKIKVFARDSGHKANKQLSDWMHKNLEALVDANCIFDFVVIDKSNKSILDQHGIKAVPAIVCGTTVKTGFIEISEYLTGYIRGNPETMRRGGGGDVSRTPEDDIFQDQMKEMSKEAMEAEKDDLGGSSSEDVRRRVEEAVQQRALEDQQRSRAQALAKGFSERAASGGSSGTGGKRGDNVPARTPASHDTRRTNDDVAAAAARTGSADDKLLAKLFEETPI